MRVNPAIVLLLTAWLSWGLIGCVEQAREKPVLVARSAADDRLVNPDKRSLEGLGVTRTASEFVCVWSVPMTNDVSPMCATAEAEVTLSCLYPAEGKPTIYKDRGEVEIEPGCTRLISGTIRVPIENVSKNAIGSPAALAGEGVFGEISYNARMTGIAWKGDGLTFDYMGKDANGFASARWTANTVRGTHKITARCDNGPATTLDTATFVGKATCILIDKDGKEVVRDAVTPTEDGGRSTAVGFIRLPSETWKTIDWRRAAVKWEWTPAAKPTSMKTIRMRVTAYCPCARCCAEMTGVTADGSNAWKPGCAADWRHFAPGTIFVVPGYERASRVFVDDRGGRVRGPRALDLRMTYHWQARAWGVRWLDCKILEG